MLNKICVQGRMTKDAELRRTNNGTAVASFTVACERNVKSGAEKETDFIDCVAWRNTAEFVDKYIGKGRMVVVDGRLQLRKWNDRDGNKRISAEVLVENIYPCDRANSNSADQAETKTNSEEFAFLDDGTDEELPW